MTEIRPWYKEALVWLLVAFPLIAVIAGLWTLYIAYKTRDGLVVDDYYQQGKEINKSFARDHAAARLGLHAYLKLDAQGRKVSITLSSKDPASLPGSITLRWLHATRAGFDHTQTLARGQDGRYHADYPDLALGHWYVQIEAQDWRLQGTLHVPGALQIELAPSLTAGPPAR
jgi:hypothetical protein